MIKTVGIWSGMVFVGEGMWRRVSVQRCAEFIELARLVVALSSEKPRERERERERGTCSYAVTIPPCIHRILYTSKNLSETFPFL